MDFRKSQYTTSFFGGVVAAHVRSNDSTALNSNAFENK